MRKSLLIGGGAIAAIAIVITAIVLSGVIEQEEGLVLSNYPKLFEKDVVIVVGENATQMEYESAEAIAANLENLTGNKPKIYISGKTESLKYTYNLIILGTPNSNEVLKEVYKMANVTRITDEYPGEGKGILEILRNPWDEEKAMLLVEGSDEWGVKAGGEMLAEEKIKEFSSEMVITDFTKEQETNDSLVIASGDELLGKYEKSDKQFKRVEIGGKIVYFHQRMINDVIVEKDYIVYQFDKNTKEFIKKIIHWRDDLPEHVTPAISKKQAESIVRGDVQSANLYFISPDSHVFPLKPTPENPCWVVTSVDNGNITITIIEAMDGKILGNGVPPP